MSTLNTFTTLTKRKNEKVQHVLSGLQSDDPGAVRDVYVNEDLKISDV